MMYLKINNCYTNSMYFIISPAKKMRYQECIDITTTQPLFIDKANYLVTKLNKLSLNEIKTIFKCNDSIALKSYNQYQAFQQMLTSPAIFCFDGIQYTYMGAKVFTNDEYDFLQNHLFIISGLYGLLRPLDEIKSYRLDFEINFSFDNNKNLYDFWSSSLHDYLFKNNDIVINLSSSEYSKSISKYLTTEDRFITLYFYEQENEKLVEKGVYCKMARGAMVRYIAENRISNIEQIKKFNQLNYKYDEYLSTNEKIVFIRKTAKVK